MGLVEFITPLRRSRCSKPCSCRLACHAARVQCRRVGVGAYAASGWHGDASSSPASAGEAEGSGAGAGAARAGGAAMGLTRDSLISTAHSSAGHDNELVCNLYGPHAQTAVLLDDRPTEEAQLKRRS